MKAWPRAGWKRVLHRFARSPVTKLVTAVFLLITGLANLVEGFIFDLDQVLEPAHALVALGALLMVESLAQTLEAVEFLDEAEGEAHEVEPR